MALELSVWSSYYQDLTPEEGMARLKQNGIDHSELGNEHGSQLLARSADVRATGRAFRAYIDSIGMTVTQGHLWLKCRIVSNPEAVDILKRWIDLYDAIGIRNIVLHADVYDMPERSIGEMHELNVAKLKQIAEFIEGRASHICFLYVDGNGNVSYASKQDLGKKDTSVVILTREGCVSVVFIKQAKSGMIWASQELNDELVTAIADAIKANDKVYKAHDAFAFGDGNHDLTYGNGKKTKTVTYFFTGKCEAITIKAAEEPIVEESTEVVEETAAEETQEK